MALPVRKGYKGAPAQAVLTNSPTSGDTSFVVDTVTGWSTTFPFYCVVEPGTSREEKVKVTAISTLTLTVVRQQDDTGPQGHNAGSAIYPVFTADEADEANEIASAMTTKGDLIATNGSSINRLGVGTNTHVLQADSTATNGFKWGQVVEAGIADSAVTSAKILDGTIVNADINASAAIALSKLATGALPTAITVASANIVDSTIVLADLAASLQAFLVPVGTITAYAGASAPGGWLLCNGTSTSGYAALAALVGATTPDLTGKFPMGKTAAGTGSTLLGTGGSNTITEGNLPAHTHSIDHDHPSKTSGGASVGHTHGQLVALIAYEPGPNQAIVTSEAGGAGVNPTYSTGGNSTDHAHDTNLDAFAGTSGSTGSGTAYFQPFLAVNYIIKHD